MALLIKEKHKETVQHLGRGMGMGEWAGLKACGMGNM